MLLSRFSLNAVLTMCAAGCGIPHSAMFPRRFSSEGQLQGRIINDAMRLRRRMRLYKGHSKMRDNFLKGLADCLMRGDVAEVLRLATQRQTLHGDGLESFLALVHMCVRDGQASLLQSLDEAAPEDGVLKLFTHAGMASIAAAEGEVEETSRRLRAAMRIGFRERAALEATPDLEQFFHVLVQQVQSIDAGDISTAGCDDPPAIDTTAEIDRLTVLTSCNAKYFDRFAPTFIASVSEYLPQAAIHIHVMNPTPDTTGRMADCSDRDARIQFSSEECREEAERFACGRFVVAHDVMRTRQSDLLISDIDVVFTGKTARLKNLLAEDDGGMFERQNVIPMEICHCSLSYFRFTEGSLRFLALLRNYLHAKLNNVEHPEWMLDQCAMFVVTRRAMRRQPIAAWKGRQPFMWCNLTECAGADLSAFQINQTIASAEKLAMRYHAEENLKLHCIPLPDGGVSVR